MTARELDALLIVTIAGLAVGMVALAGWPSVLSWRRRYQAARRRRADRGYVDTTALFSNLRAARRGGISDLDL